MTCLTYSIEWSYKQYIIESEWSEVSMSSHIRISRLNDIQTVLKPLKKLEQIEIHFYEHFRTSWIIWSDRNALWRLISSESLIDRELKYLQKSGFKFSIYAIKI